MAQATAVLTVDNFPFGIDNTQRRVKVYGTVAIGTTSETYLTTGLPLSWQTLVDKSGQNVLINTQQLTPVRVSFEDYSGTGYVFQWNKAHDSIQIFLTGTAANDPLNEFGENDIPSAIATATIVFTAEFIRAVA
jgi:hypothetical protein